MFYFFHFLFNISVNKNSIRVIAFFCFGENVFYGSSYFVDPRGQIFAQASEDKDELLIAEFDLDMIEEVRSVWQFFRDRRPETYGKLVEL